MQTIDESANKPALPPARLTPSSAQRNGSPQPPVSQKVNILLVDDRDDKLLALEAVLSSLGQNLVIAHSGKEALRHLLKTDVAVILLDVSMPGMDGFETAGLIRQRPCTEHTPIIFVTSVDQSDTQVYKGYSLGAVDYILTPIVPEVLRAKVAVFVDLYLKTEQIRQQGEQLRHMEETEHRQRLAEAVNRLEAETKRNRFFTLALDLLGIGNFDGRLLQVNPAWEKLLGYTEEELKAVPAVTFAHPDDHPAIYERVRLLQQGLSVDYFEIRAKHKDGSYRWLGWTAAPFLSEKLIYIFGRDVTARKEAENQIQQLNSRLHQQVGALTDVNRELEAFNYSISHDLRAPLRSMQSFAQILLDDHAPDLSKEGQEMAARIVRSSHYLDRLLADLLTYSRLTNAELPRVAINLDDTLSQILSLLEKDIKDKAAVLEIDRPLGWVAGHPATINQILANLVGNALKFVPPDRAPRIRIASKQHDGKVRFSVQDNGIGIEPDHHRKIFGLFERLHSSQDYPGTGIGLALVRKGAERMGGRAGLLSEPGQGSLFWVDLPAAEKPTP